MIYINEWFPNPTGSDAPGEFIELYNSGKSPINLDEWIVATESGKRATLSGHTIASGGYLILKKTDIRLSLKNTAGGLSLYSSDGGLIDHASFLGSAPEGKSFSRVDYGASQAEHFAFVGPTPGAANKRIDNQIASISYSLNKPLNPPLGLLEWLGFLVGVAAIIPALFIYVIKKNENISKLFFSRNHGPR